MTTRDLSPARTALTLASGGLTHSVVSATGATDDGHGDPRVARETRPKNAAVYFYIRIN